MTTRREVIALVAALLLTACARRREPARAARPFLDMVGRTVWLPAVVGRMFSTSPMGTTLSYTFDPDLLVGTNYPVGEADAPYLVERYRRLPVIGGWFGKTAGANLELLMRTPPDLILSVGTAPDAFAQDHSRMLSEMTGVPVALLTMYGLSDIPRVYEAMGEITGNRPRATALAAHARRLIERARAVAARIQPERRVRVYYAEGLKGLNTEPKGSMHAELIEFCGGANVAEIAENNVTGYGNTPVSLEQVVAWDPDVILISDYLGKDGGAAGWQRVLGENPLWQRTKAVRDHRVHVVPKSPFQWIDRPPSVNRLAGAIWLPWILYPSACDYDVRTEVRELFSAFYHHRIGDEALDALLDTAVIR